MAVYPVVEFGDAASMPMHPTLHTTNLFRVLLF